MLTRRDLLRGLGWLGAGCATRAAGLPTGGDRDAVTVELTANGAAGGPQNVQFGVPLPPGWLDAADRVLRPPRRAQLSRFARVCPHHHRGALALRPDHRLVDRKFWTPRNQAYGLLGVVHGWELTGDPSYARRARDYGDALAAHQAQPPDGQPPDGSWRQDWAVYDPSESRLPGATSAWMTAILGAALFHYWFVFRDDRVPMMITAVCDFLDRKAFRDDGRPYYVVDCFGNDSVLEAPGVDSAGPGSTEPGTERHSLELAYLFAMGVYFCATDAALRARLRRRFDALYARALTLDLNRPPRAYNWAFHASSQLLYFMLR
ncbi:MAG TPA: hypothetical protein VH165_06515 [Kofleriaceae bacterium]|jgi:hypothetical protein|nr:hypothetical protein [Kofleriaceae bacterium]